MINRNSALIWLPKIEAAGLPTPKTIVVPYEHEEVVAFLEGGADEKATRSLYDVITVACDEIGWPCFIRTDLASAKHAGPDAYLARDRQNVWRAILKTVEDNEMKFWLESMAKGGPQAFMVRQFLDLDHSFTAFGDLPISREWRLFAGPDGLICGHPYWPEEAIEFWNKTEGPAGWKDLLADHHKKPDNFDQLTDMAVQAVKACGGGEWSVDFAMDKSGKWWLIDMALKEDSWHWPGCPHGPDPEQTRGNHAVDLGSLFERRNP